MGAASFALVDPVVRARAAKLVTAVANLTGEAVSADDPAAALALFAKALKKGLRVDDVTAGLPVFAGPPDDIAVVRQPGTRGTVHLYNTSGATLDVTEVLFDVRALFSPASSVRYAVTHEQIASKIFASRPSSSVPPDQLFDVWVHSLHVLMQLREEQKGVHLTGFSGIAIIRIAGRDPFAISISGR